MSKKDAAVAFADNEKIQGANTPLGIYLSLGFFIFFACSNYYGTLALPLLGSEREQLLYGAGCIAAALGVALSLLFGLLCYRREKRAKSLLLICYPLAALLIITAALVRSPVIFLCVFLLFYLLVGLNAGLCAYILCKRYAGGGAGKLLGVTSCLGLAACYLVSLPFSLGSLLMITVNVICFVAALLALLYLAAKKLDIFDFMKPTRTLETSSRIRRRYRYVLCAICGAIAVMSYMIGINDIAISMTLFGNPGPINVSLILPQLLYLPGLLLAGVLADVRRGRFLPLAVLACMFLATPVISLLSSPDQYMLYSAITYFLGGLFLIYIMISITAIVHRSRRPTLDASLAAFIFFLLSGLGAFSSSLFIGAGVFVTISVYAILSLCLFLAFYLSGGLRAVSLADPEPEQDSYSTELRKTLEELVLSYGITERETEALRLLITGRSTADIASEMFITEKSVQKYITSMLSKTGAESRVKLVTMFFHAKP